MEINDFLDRYCFDITLNMNDTFAYACAWGVSVDTSDLPLLLEIEKKYGSSGVTAFASVIEDVEPIEPLVDEEYQQAKNELKGKTFYSLRHCHDEYHYILCRCVEEIPLFGAPIQYRGTKRTSKEGYMIQEAYTKTGYVAEGSSQSEARENLLKTVK